MNVIAHNLLAMNAQRQFGIVNTKQSKTTEKLSSGYKINRAADDAAGLTISEKMRSQIRGLNQAADNIQEGISYVQTADGALNEVHDILHRMNELAVQSANDTNTEQDREAIDSEVQQLKEEIDRIFLTTTFNERPIWKITGTKKLLGTEKKQAVTSSAGSEYLEVTNSNYDVFAYGSYKLNADDNGINVTWKGYNNKTYQTKTIDWNTLKDNNYSFDMSDYFDVQVNSDLFDSAGNPVFKKTISFNVEETATIQDMIVSINGAVIYSSPGASMAGRFENTDGSSKATNMGVSSSIRYEAAYASKKNSANGRDFDAADDKFLEPTGGSGTANLISKPQAATVADARNSNEGWTFSFNMEGIGTVKGTSSSISYSCGDKDEAYEGLWWSWGKDYKGDWQKYTNSHFINSGTLGDVMSALTGDKNDTTPGLLSSNAGGASKNGGSLSIYFNLTADNAFNYAGQTSKNVGSFSLSISVKKDDTEQTILDKINAALNDQTVLDFYSDSKYYDNTYFGKVTTNTHLIDVPIWGGNCELNIQSGANGNEHIQITYDSLSTHALGLQDTNVLTGDDCNKAIDEISAAVDMVSAQRSEFGAYQNRFEHAYSANKNTEENTMASESLIRDTDMAETMVENSKNNILSQAVQAMLAQAGQNPQGILSLLS